MKHSSFQFCIPILLSLFIIETETYALNIQDVKADSLRKEIERGVGAEKISSQLELALHIFEKSNQEAKEVAISALESSKKLGYLDLEMRSYYIHGRIYTAFEEIALSQTYLDSALLISNILGSAKYKGEILFRQGVNHYKNSDQVKALETYSEALLACRETNDFKTMGSVYSMMGTLFRVNGDYDRAIEYNIKSSLSYGKADFEEGKAWVNYLLGRIYADLQSPQRALVYFKESLSIYEQIASADGNRNGLAICHEQIALQEMTLGNYPNARASIKKVLDIHTDDESKYGISSAYIIFGKIEYAAGNFDLAKNYLRKALDLKMEIIDVSGLSVIYEYLGLCLVAKGRLNEGLDMIKQGLQQAEENKQRKIQLDIHKKLADIYVSNGMPGKASFYQGRVIEIQDELLFGGADTKMEQLQAFYEIDEKNEQISDLEKENELHSLRIQQQRTNQVFMIIGILLAAIIALVIYIFSRKIQQNNKELKELNLTKDKLFSIISHDLQGPMGTTRGLSEVLLEKWDNKNDSKFDEIFHAMHKNIHDSYDLLTNLLQWARSQFKGIQFTPETLSMHEMATRAINSNASQAQQKNIGMTVDMNENISVWADIAMLEAVLRNLITNAIKFTKEGGQIEIHAIKKPGLTQVCIKDDGIGMSSETSENLFSLEANTSTSGTKGEKGTGLGLIVCKDFVEMHKGEIWVESILNKGTSFYFTIPDKDYA